MSTWREQLSGETVPQEVYEWLEDYYHYPVVAALFVFSFWLRTTDWQRFVVGDTVLYSGNDPFYHLRSVQYTVENWPATMPYEVWTYFPYGTSTAQFGTLFDQLVATAALILGLGSPSDQLVRLVVLFAPAVFGVLVFVPAYVIGKRLGGRFGGVLAVAVMAFANDRLYSRSFVGFSDHHVAEALFQAIAVLGLMVAITVAESEKPVYELAAERAFGTLRLTVGWSVLAGIAIALYMFVWPPGVFLVGILGVFFVLYLSVEYLRGRSPEHVGIAGAVAMATAGVLVLSTVQTLEFNATARSMLHPLAAFGVAAGCLFMAWLARTWDETDLPAYGYPASVVGLGVVLVGLLAVVTPDTYAYLQNNVLRVVGLGIGATATGSTVGEISPMPLDALVDYYGLAAVAAAGGGTLAIYRYLADDDPRGQELLVVVWMLFVLLASLTQVRFAYYLTVPVAALTALLAGSVVRYVASQGTDDGIATYQILTVVVIVMLVIAPMAVFAGDDDQTAITASTPKDPGLDVRGWQDSLAWMQDDTPIPGQYANPDGEAMDYSGTYARTDDFDYPPGAYGVLSWWDYGHWITAQAQRIPNANPFQQGANHAARFLLADNETSAAAELADRDEDDAETRYVMADWKMADADTRINGKFFAPATFREGVDPSDYYSYVLSEQGGVLTFRHKQAYYDSMVSRLYHYHGSAMEPEPIVLDWQGQERDLPSLPGNTFVQAPGEASNVSLLQQFDSMAEAREYVAEQPSSRQIGGIGPYPSERVPALEHYRLVHASNSTALESRSYQQSRLGTIQGTNLLETISGIEEEGDVWNWLHRTSPSWTKTFERVPGATIEGTGPANTNVTASVQMRPNAGTPFTYTQRTQTDADGQFSLTVPYASTGYDELGPEEGYTNTTVRATGPYQVYTGFSSDDEGPYWHEGQVDVTEGQVVGEDDSAATVTLERTEPDSGNETDGENATDGQSGPDGDGSTTDDSLNVTDGEGTTTDDGDTGNDTSPALAPPAAPTSAPETRAVQP